MSEQHDSGFVSAHEVEQAEVIDRQAGRILELSGKLDKIKSVLVNPPGANDSNCDDSDTIIAIMEILGLEHCA